MPGLSFFSSLFVVRSLPLVPDRAALQRVQICRGLSCLDQSGWVLSGAEPARHRVVQDVSQSSEALRGCSAAAFCFLLIVAGEIFLVSVCSSHVCASHVYLWATLQTC